MRILLDAKDLINVVEREAPIGIQALNEFLNKGNHQLVLTFTSLREFAAGFTTDEDFLRLRYLLRKIESLSLCFLKEGGLQEREVLRAYEAFCNGLEPEPTDPYRRWDFTLDDRPATEIFVNYRLV